MYYYFEKNSQLNLCYELLPNLNINLLKVIPTIDSEIIRRKMIVQLVRGVNYLHTLPTILIHFNIRPENILWDDMKQLIKITNFTKANFYKNEKILIPLTLTRYCGPEYSDGIFDTKFDVYAMGMTIVFINSGNLPYFDFDEHSIPGLVYNRVLPLEVYSMKDVHLRQILEECLHLQPDMRPTCLEVLAKLTVDENPVTHSCFKTMEVDIKPRVYRSAPPTPPTNKKRISLKPILYFPLEDYVSFEKLMNFVNKVLIAFFFFVFTVG